jgi:hypothetical protein
MTEFADILPQLKGKDIYFYLTKENPDWLNHNSKIELVFHFDGKKVSLPLNDTKNLSYLASSIYHFIDSNNIVLCWNAKDIFSFFKGRTEIPLEIFNNIYDLYIINSYFSLKSEKPESFKDAVKILKKALNISDWKRFNNIYNQVFVPLFSKTLPDIETSCLIDNSKRKCIYPSYVIEGQANGRLKTCKINSSCYNPHSMGHEEKNNIRPKDYDEVFVYFDYKNMEVNVLQWLSGDKELSKIISDNKDIYKEIWRKVTKQEPTEAHRTLCKNIFLPVVFGQGKASLSKKLGVSEEIASKLINNLQNTFHVAFDWVSAQSADSNNMAIDFFGRRRIFEQEELYKIKNFCIQSPASLICLKKLVCLHESLSGHATVCFHVHDGYCVLCKKTEVDFIAELGKKVLESEDELFPNLKLKTTCHYGNNFNNLKSLTKEVMI